MNLIHLIKSVRFNHFSKNDVMLIKLLRTFIWSIVRGCKQQIMRLIPIVSLNKWPLSSMKDVFKTLHLSDDNESLRRCNTIMHLNS